MASRTILPQLTKRAATTSKLATTPKGLWLPQNQRSMASVNPPVTQDMSGSKGPTAMVFMNMGGPSTTDDVGDFLSRLFVC
jgi:ferrochelatase